MARRWLENLRSTSRGKILTLLQRLPRSAADLATELEISHTAVRTHIDRLERDGLVEAETLRRGSVGKPARVYTLSKDGEALFPKAYALALSGLLQVLEQRMTRGEIDDILGEVGRAAASQNASPAGSDRLEHAQRTLEHLGAVTDVQRDGERVRIQGYACPFSELIDRHPEICRIVEALLAEQTGMTVRETCKKGARPRCAFELS